MAVCWIHGPVDARESVCWGHGLEILDFLTGRPQVVRVGEHTSSTLIRNIGAPQGCVFSPLLCYLYTYDCVTNVDSNIIETRQQPTPEHRQDSFKYLSVHIIEDLTWTLHMGLLVFRRVTDDEGLVQHIESTKVNTEPKMDENHTSQSNYSTRM